MPKKKLPGAKTLVILVSQSIFYLEILKYLSCYSTKYYVCISLFHLKSLVIYKKVAIGHATNLQPSRKEFICREKTMGKKRIMHKYRDKSFLSRKKWNKRHNVFSTACRVRSVGSQSCDKRTFLQVKRILKTLDQDQPKSTACMMIVLERMMGLDIHSFMVPEVAQKQKELFFFSAFFAGRFLCVCQIFVSFFVSWP